MDSTTKMAVIGVGVFGAYIAYNNIHKSKTAPQSRKHRKGFTANKIDHQIDNQNRVSGGRVPANPDVPFYSRHNYNRRRRSIVSNYF